MGLRGINWRRLAVRLSVLAIILLVIGCIAFCIGTPVYYHDKLEAPGVRVASDAIPGAWAPERQSEPHTCGFHAMWSLYRAYGVSPDHANLRFRLGTDMRATNFDPDSLGTIHPDMLRVLSQDGFVTSVLAVVSPDDNPRIRTHLEAGHPVLALIRVTGLHWVVLTGVEGEDVVICDSLQPELCREPLKAYVSERLLSGILVRPAP